MNISFKLLLIIHIAFGSIGLLTGLFNIIQKKGDKGHKIFGSVFYFSMLLAGFSSLMLSCLHPNYFLFMIGLFTLYMVSSGQRYIKQQQHEGQKIEKLDWVISIIMSIAGILFIGLGIWSIIKSNLFGLVFLAFGGLGLLFVCQDFLNFTNKPSIKNYWLIGHLQRMVGAFIASMTAFLVVNATFLPDTIPGFVYWLLPTTVFTPIIIKWSKKYQAKVSKSNQ
jgi:uncharacterized membrane protein